MTITQDAVANALISITGPDGQTPLPRSGALGGIAVKDGRVYVSIEVGPAQAQAAEPLRAQVEALVKGLAGVSSVLVTLTAQKAPGTPSAHSHRPSAPPQQPGPRVQAARAGQAVPGVKTIIAVASGKGGVGKSTTAVNIALALQAEGLRIGILDADLYGPSIPKLLGIEGQPAIRDDGIFSPHEAFGLKAMSIGSMLVKDQAVVWRGPMATSALRQLLRETDWGSLDVLVVDLPPGTGDIQISLFQQALVDGVVIVSTPQDLALIDAKKAIDMIRRFDVPLLGLVENMSYFIAPDTGTRYDIFGSGGAERAAGDLGLPFLGAVPLVMSIREGSDAGVPPLVAAPDGPEAAAYRAICRAVLAQVPVAPR